jgi:hypothetical protein
LFSLSESEAKILNQAEFKAIVSLLVARVKTLEALQELGIKNQNNV